MTFETIRTFEDFCQGIRKAGFAVGGSNDEGIFSLRPWWDSRLREHTGEAETDPWIWRIQVVRECDDIAYGTLFFKKSGWITRAWYPYFLAARRNGKTFQDLYQDGHASSMAHRIHQVVEQRTEISLRDIKLQVGCGKSENTEFQNAITQLQSGLFITICGEIRKLGKTGRPYGWPVTTFCLADTFFSENVFARSCGIDHDEAVDKITTRIRALNPNASAVAIDRFIHGG